MAKVFAIERAKGLIQGLMRQGLRKDNITRASDRLTIALPATSALWPIVASRVARFVCPRGFALRTGQVQGEIFA